MVARRGSSGSSGRSARDIGENRGRARSEGPSTPVDVTLRHRHRGTPMKKRYPLEPLVKLRREKVDRRASELGDAERQAALDQAALAGAKARRLEEQERSRSEAGAERARLEQGLERAHDLARGELYRVSERLRLEALAAAERKAARKSEATER